MSDNVVEFPKEGVEPPKTPQGPSSDDILKDAVGKYDDVIVIGINKERAQCLSSLGLDEAVYELSRALHRLHCYIDRA